MHDAHHHSPGSSPRSVRNRATGLLVALAIQWFALPTQVPAQQIDDDSIVVIERGQPGVNAWDISELPFKVLTVPLYLLAVGGEWAAGAASDARLVQRLAYYNYQLNRRSIYLAFASLGSGSGTGAAFRLGPSGEEGRIWGNVAAGATVKRYWRITAQAGYGPEVVEPGHARSFGIQALASLGHRDRDEYWGLGPDTREQNRSDYAVDRKGVAGELLLGVIRHVALRAQLDWSDTETGPGNNSRFPDVDSLFPPDELPRFGERDRYVSFGASAEWRNGYSGLFIPGGSWVRIAGRWNDGRSNGAADFSELQAGGGLYLRFDHGRRCFSLEGTLQTTRPQGDGEIPFYRLPTLGGASTLPAYPTARFRDRDAAFVRIEYLYRIWLGPTNNFAWVASVFMAGGQVARDLREELALSRLRDNYGIALIAYAGPTSGGRLELAGGDEGLRVNLVFLVGS